MGEPCGKCGSKATYTNHVFSAAGKGLEHGCLMCGWRDRGVNSKERQHLAPPPVLTLVKKTPEKKYGTCTNCLRENVRLMTAKFCGTCYPYRDDEKGMRNVAERIRTKAPRPREPKPLAASSGQIVVDFQGEDAELYAEFVQQAKFYRRTPENHALFLIQREVHEAQALKREAGT